MITIDVDEDLLIQSLDGRSARELIVAIDKKQQCCDFTIKTIKMLIDSLEADMGLVDIAEELGFTYIE